MALQNLKKKFTIKRIIAAVQEAIVGTNPGSGYKIMRVLSGPTNAVQADYVEQDVIGAKFGSLGSIATTKTFENSFQTYAVGAEAGNDPDYDAVLQACSLKKEDGFYLNIVGMTGAAFSPGESVETTAGTALGTVLAWTPNVGVSGTASTTGGELFIFQAGTATTANIVSGDNVRNTATTTVGELSADSKASITYSPTSLLSEQKTATILDFPDGQRRISTHSMGNIVVTFEAGELPTLDYTMSGLYSAPTDTTAIDEIAPADITPSPWIDARCQVGSLKMDQVFTSSFSVDAGNTVVMPKGGCSTDGIAAISITDANPTGAVSISRPDLVDFNPYDLMQNSTTFEVFTQHGSVENQRVRLGVPKAQLNAAPTDGDVDGQATYDLAFSCNISDSAEIPAWHVVIY